MYRNRDSFTKEEFKLRVAYGEKILPAYYEQSVPTWNKIAVTERTIKNIEIQGVPIKGNLDKIEFEGKNVTIVDYKTGKPDPKGKVIAPNEKHPNGSDYWLQMIFYAILLKSQKTTASSGFPSASSTISSTFYFVNQTSEKTYVKAEVTPDTENIQFVEDLIQTTYSKIKSLQFTPGCGKPTCEWCKYVNSGVEVSLVEVNEEDDESSEI